MFNKKYKYMPCQCLCHSNYTQDVVLFSCNCKCRFDSDAARLNAENQQLKTENERLSEYYQRAKDKYISVLRENNKLKAKLGDYDNINAEYRREYEEHEELKKFCGEQQEIVRIIAKDNDDLRSKNKDLKAQLQSHDEDSKGYNDDVRDWISSLFCPCCIGSKGCSK